MRQRRRITARRFNLHHFARRALSNILRRHVVRPLVRQVVGALHGREFFKGMGGLATPPSGYGLFEPRHQAQ